MVFILLTVLKLAGLRKSRFIYTRFLRISFNEYEMNFTLIFNFFCHLQSLIVAFHFLHDFKAFASDSCGSPRLYLRSDFVTCPLYNHFYKNNDDIANKIDDMVYS